MVERKRQMLKRQVQAAERVLEHQRGVLRKLAGCEAAESGKSRKKKTNSRR